MNILLEITRSSFSQTLLEYVTTSCISVYLSGLYDYHVASSVSSGNDTFICQMKVSLKSFATYNQHRSQAYHTTLTVQLSCRAHQCNYSWQVIIPIINPVRPKETFKHVNFVNSDRSIQRKHVVPVRGEAASEIAMSLTSSSQVLIKSTEKLLWV